jgi:hypothetical protein
MKRESRALAAGEADATPPSRAVIEVHVAELRQLFNSIDPSPFRERDLAPAAEAFIVDWSRELPSDLPLALLVHLERSAGPPNETVLLGQAIHQFFASEAEASRRRLRRLFQRGRISLVIGLAVLAGCIGLAQLALRWAGDGGLDQVVHESLLIGGWVAMWRPLEVFLYDWWPIRADVRLFDRLAVMPVRIRYATASPSGADAERWRRDWPAAPVGPRQGASPPPASLPGDMPAS